MSRRRTSSVHGILVVDKPAGPTSHTVVGWARRVFGTRSVGHAGTLDPLATGVLILGIGEGTKLLRWLTAEAKRYEAVLRLGARTETLDAEGEVVEERPLPPWDPAALEAAMAGLRGVHAQVPPMFSAIQVDGERLHAKARRGETVEVPPRQVHVHELTGSWAAEDEVHFAVHASKGFYVRSLGRDLAEALGTCGHLVGLRRSASGSFTLDDAVGGADLEAAAGDRERRAAVLARLLPMEVVERALPMVRVDGTGAEHVAHGRPVPAVTVLAAAPEAADAEAVGLLGPEGKLLGVGAPYRDGFRVVRGLRYDVPETPRDGTS